MDDVPFSMKTEVCIEINEREKEFAVQHVWLVQFHICLAGPFLTQAFADGVTRWLQQ